MMVSSFIVLCVGGVLFGLAERVPGLTGTGLALLCGAYPALLRLLALQWRVLQPAGTVNGQSARGQFDASAAGHLSASTAGRGWASRLLALGVFVLAALAGSRLGGWFELPMLSIWSPALAGVLFAAVATLVSARLLRLGSAQPAAALLLPVGALFGFALMSIEPPRDTPVALQGALNAMVAGTTGMLPGVPFERAVVVSGTLAVVEELFVRGPWWLLLLVMLLIPFGAVSFAQGCLTLLARFPAATELLLLTILMGGTTRLWPWQVVSTYTLTRSGGQLALSSKPVGPAAYLQHTGEAAHTVQVLLFMSLAVVLTLALLRNQKLQHGLDRLLEPWLGPRTWRAVATATRLPQDRRS